MVVLAPELLSQGPAGLEYSFPLGLHPSLASVGVDPGLGPGLLSGSELVLAQALFFCFSFGNETAPSLYVTCHSLIL